MEHDYSKAPPSSLPPGYAPPASVEYGGGNGGPSSNPYAYSALPPTSTGSSPGVYPPPQGGPAPGSENPYGAPPVQYGQQPPPQYGQQPPQQHSSQPGFQPPMYAPPAYEQGNQPYQGFAPPTYAASQQMSPPPHQQSAPSFQVGVVVEQKIAFSPLSYGSSFVAFIRSHRHHNKYISLDQHMEICFTERPTMHWNFILSNTRDCYFVVCQWAGAPNPALQLKVPPTPLFLRAMRGANWIVGRSFGVSSPETAFYLENHGGHFALRNQASGQYVSAEDNCLRANRREYKDWEKFSIEILRTDQSLTLLTPYGPILANEAVPCFDLVMTYHVAFRARIRTNRYGGTIGLHKKSISPCNHDTTWEFIPAHHRQAYLIRNADHPDVYWTATAKDNAVKAGAPREGESEFEVNFKGSHYFFRSVATGRFATADGSRIVCNRENAAGWEAFAIDVQHQLEM